VAPCNTATDAFALFTNTAGFRNNAVGVGALQNHSIAPYTNAVGTLALFSDQSGSNNDAFGGAALSNNVSGIGNTAIRDSALYNNGGNYNTALGAEAGVSATTGERGARRLAFQLQILLTLTSRTFLVALASRHLLVG
jgi:trimeric autotransporter adhesin